MCRAVLFNYFYFYLFYFRGSLGNGPLWSICCYLVDSNGDAPSICPLEKTLTPSFMRKINLTVIKPDSRHGLHAVRVHLHWSKLGMGLHSSLPGAATGLVIRKPQRPALCLRYDRWPCVSCLLDWLVLCHSRCVSQASIIHSDASVHTGALGLCVCPCMHVCACVRACACVCKKELISWLRSF